MENCSGSIPFAGEWWKSICQWPGVVVCDRCKRVINERNCTEHPFKVCRSICYNGCNWNPCKEESCGQ